MSGRMSEIKLKCGGAALLPCCRFLGQLHKHLLFAVKYVTITLLNKGDGGFMSLPDALQPDLPGFARRLRRFAGVFSDSPGGKEGLVSVPQCPLRIKAKQIKR